MACVCVFSHVRLFVAPVLCLVEFPLALSMGFPRQECWSGLPLPFPPLGDLLTKGLNPRLLHLLHWQMDSWPLRHLEALLLLLVFPVLDAEPVSRSTYLKWHSTCKESTAWVICGSVQSSIEGCEHSWIEFLRVRFSERQYSLVVNTHRLWTKNSALESCGSHLVPGSSVALRGRWCKVFMYIFSQVKLGKVPIKV